MTNHCTHHNFHGEPIIPPVAPLPGPLHGGQGRDIPKHQGQPVTNGVVLRDHVGPHVLFLGCQCVRDQVVSMLRVIWLGDSCGSCFRVIVG